MDERNRGAEAAAATRWRRVAKGLRRRPGQVPIQESNRHPVPLPQYPLSQTCVEQVYETLFSLLDGEMKGCIQLRAAYRFLSYMLPYTMPSDRLVLLKLSVADAARVHAGAAASVLLRSDFVDLCLRLLWSVPLSTLERCVSL